jgi:hypothetical protein
LRTGLTPVIHLTGVFLFGIFKPAIVDLGATSAMGYGIFI